MMADLLKDNVLIDQGKTNPVEEALLPLIGLKLSIARRAADMRNFGFGEIRQAANGLVGEYALHISCPWRIDGPQGILLRRSDLWEHISGEVTPDDWEPSTIDNLQDVRIKQLLQGYDPRTDSFVNTTDDLVVTSIQATLMGDAIIGLSGGYQLKLFPDGTRGEAWRIFRPGDSDYPHFVVDEEGTNSI
jgi:hypothetical protein